MRREKERERREARNETKRGGRTNDRQTDIHTDMPGFPFRCTQRERESRVCSFIPNSFIRRARSDGRGQINQSINQSIKSINRETQKIETNLVVEKHAQKSMCLVVLCLLFSLFALLFSLPFLVGWRLVVGGLFGCVCENGQRDRRANERVEKETREKRESDTVMCQTF